MNDGQEDSKTKRPAFRPLAKFKVILGGLRYAFVNDFPVAYKIILSLVVIAVGLIYQKDVHFALILLATGFMVVAEMLNSAIEGLCDFVQPNHDPKIGRIKDVSASAAGLSILVWFLVVLSEVLKAWGVISPPIKQFAV